MIVWVLVFVVEGCDVGGGAGAGAGAGVRRGGGGGGGGLVMLGMVVWNVS